MMSASERLHKDAESLGIERPSLEYKRTVDQEGTTVVSLTEQSEMDWANYMRAVTIAKLSLQTHQ